MADYINRAKAIETFLSNGCVFVHGEKGVKAIISRLQMIPAVDAVEVIRCKDCKHYVARYCTRDINGRTNMFLMSEDDFCSYGERKTDNG